MAVNMSENPTLRRRLPVALARQAFWQIWCRTVRRPMTVRMAAGYKIPLPPWSNLAGITFATGLHEPREELFALAYLRPGDVAIDVGANIGIYTALMGSTGAHVIAFEPGSRSRSDLARTVALNPGMSIEVVPAALSDNPGRMSITLDLESSNHLVQGVADDLQVESVEVMMLDDYAVEHHLENLVFIKIDAEGFDLQVLRGAKELLKSQKPVLMVETWGPPDIRDWLEGLGYRIYRYAFETRLLHEYPRPFSDQANILAVHQSRLDLVRQRVEGAKAPSLKLPQIVRLRT